MNNVYQQKNYYQTNNSSLHMIPYTNVPITRALLQLVVAFMEENIFVRAMYFLKRRKRITHSTLLKFVTTMISFIVTS